jgi:hypothetical protein
MAPGLLVWKAAIRGFCERVDRVGRIAAVRKAAAIEGFTENGLLVMAEEQLCRSIARRMHDAMVLMLTTMTEDTANAKCTDYRVLHTVDWSWRLPRWLSPSSIRTASWFANIFLSCSGH